MSHIHCGARATRCGEWFPSAMKDGTEVPGRRVVAMPGGERSEKEDTAR